jgi:DNA helicase INO80
MSHRLESKGSGQSLASLFPTSSSGIVSSLPADSLQAADTQNLVNEASEATSIYIQQQLNAAREFDRERPDYQNGSSAFAVVSTDAADNTYTQPKMFRGLLKAYQLKGMNWLLNLYDQGINGILADEMGLGKTIQAISFLCHLAEVKKIWGPFLIVAPNSTLHQWQQEFLSFAPTFKVEPYWGNPSERAVLRKYWTSKHMYRAESSCHVVITSYNTFVGDEKHFSRVKWQYMVLDEAHAIKNASSSRWKALLGLKCRNRLLLTGTRAFALHLE